MERLSLHRAIQTWIADRIGPELVKIEHPFPQHFADLYWPEKNLIFEIQCSPLSIQEAIKRNEDYEALGLHVIWILHQKTFNQRVVGATELYLRSRSAYYTDIYSNNTGMIYDQDELVLGHRRVFRSQRYRIEKFEVEPLSWPQTWVRRVQIDALWRHGKRPIVLKFDRRYKNLKQMLRLFATHWRFFSKF